MKEDQLAIVSSPIIMTVIYELLQIYKLSTFIITMLDAFYQSLICFFVPYLVSTSAINILLSSLKNRKIYF